MPLKYPVIKIRYPRNGVKAIEVTAPISLWDAASNGYRWVHHNDIIDTQPNSPPSLVRNTLQTINGYIMVTFYPSGNLSGLLVRVDDR